MSNERELERICQAALERPPAERAALLAEACGGDERLRREAESLLARDGAAASFLETPAVAIAARTMSTDTPALTVGQQIGPYTIVSRLGSGGMGEVYRARDTTLPREVAIKVVPTIFTSDPERLGRFEREARLLASLNHPNIATIYGLESADGVKALVMELVEGEDLAQRITRGAIPLGEALPIAKQISEALEAAHEQSIVHRDLKPANIKVRPDGTVKVLDFGLAKAMATDGLATDASQLPTQPISGTRAGMILGTAAYMSPEQAQGRAVDKRADIWAFGVVLFEMLTGRRLFTGETVADTLASVLKTDPDWRALPTALPPRLGALLRRCLDKDPKRRLRDIGDARVQIEDLLAGVPEETGTAVIRATVPIWRRALPWSLAGAGLAALLTLWAPWRSASPLAPPTPEVRLEINTPPTPDPTSLAISPDGRKIVFVADSEGRPRLWLRLLDSGTARPLKQTDRAQFPFWSPDSRSVGFFADGELKRIDIDGGSVQTLANAGNGRGGAWSGDGTILFAMQGGPIFRVSDKGGETVAVTQLDSGQGSHFSPQFLPDGRHFLYGVRGSPEVAGIHLGQLGSAQSRRLLDADPGATYVVSGHLLFVREDALFAQNFDPVRLELVGNPFSVAERVASGQSGGLSVSGAGSITYRTASEGAQRQLVWFDRFGKEFGRAGDSVTTTMSEPSLSRDGQRVAMYRPNNGNVDIWLLETKRGGFSRFTYDVADDVMPVWSPDGDRIVFSSNRKGTHDLYEKSATAGGMEELLLSTPQHKFATDWSRDGRFVLYESRESPDPRGSFDIWALPLDGKGKPFEVVQTKFDERGAQFSPAGNWIAYQSDESGRVEIYVQPFPGPGNGSPISTHGGSQVRWRRDGKELFYVALDGRLTSVPIRVASNDGTLEVGIPVTLFAPPLGNAVQQGDYRHQYMVAPDGQQFLVATVSEGSNSPIAVILNWKARP